MLDFRDREELHLSDPTYIPSNLDCISNPNALHDSFVKYKQSGVIWKESVQGYGMNELRNNIRLHNEIESGTYKQSKPNHFILNERGHVRFISSEQVRDKVVQNSLNKNILEPRILPHLIYDNGASQKGKGVSFSRSRFENHLRNAYNEFGPNGYILMIDFSKYFDNILHTNLINMMAPYLTKYELEFFVNVVKEFEIDVSYMSDEEYKSCLDSLFNSLEYNNTVDRERLNKTKMMAKSLPIGSHTSQISGLFYPHQIDNYCKYVKSIKYYGRYMDDSYIIMQNKEDLRNILNEISQICNGLGIFINFKKTKIQPLYSEISFLKIRYFFCDGRLIRKVTSESIQRELHKLRKYKHLLDNKRIGLQEIINNYKSWRGTYIKYDSGDEIHKLDLFFLNLFGLEYKVLKKNKPV